MRVRRLPRCPARRRCTSSPARNGRRCVPVRTAPSPSGCVPVAPTGWPSEIPEPFGLVFAGSKPRSFATAQACAANASFDSITSMSSSDSPARCQRRAGGRHRADAHDLRIDAGMCIRHQPPQRLRAALCRGRRIHQHHRGGAVVDAGRIARGHRAVLAEHRPQLRRDRRPRHRRGHARRCRTPSRRGGSSVSPAGSAP